MIRVKDLEKSVAFYRDHCGMVEIDRLDFPEWKFTLAFMATIPAEEREALPKPGTEEAHTALWGFSGTTIELTYNYGTEKDPEFQYDSGNELWAVMPRFAFAAAVAEYAYGPTSMGQSSNDSEHIDWVSN